MSFEFEFTQDKLAHVIPNAKYGVAVWYNELVELLPVFEITSVGRVAAFLAQTAHESGGYTAMMENLNYSAESLCKVWPTRFKSVADSQPYNRNPEAIANKVYASRMGNGDEHSGEGYKYRGRGLLQLTGKSNYSAFAEYAGIGVADAPDYIETPRGAVHSACWFWFSNDLNTFADAGDFEGMTKRINGGVIGLADRIHHYNHAVEVLGA
jgi:putative chitinase